MTTIELPPYGLTLLPPWWCAILWAGKRIENRVQSVAARIGKYRGPVAITSSKTFARRDALAMLAEIFVSHGQVWDRSSGPIVEAIRARSGMIVGVADIVDVRANGAQPSDPWAVPGQWGVSLANVREVVPVPCTGGLGFFSFGACPGCGRPTAYAQKPGLQCRPCKSVTPHGEVGRPMLTEVTC